MGIIRSISRSITRSIFRTIENTDQIISRYIRTFNGSGTYGELLDPVTFTGDYEVEIEFSPTSVAAHLALADSPDTTDRHLIYLTITTGNVVYTGASITSVELNEAPISSNTTAPPLGEISVIKIFGNGIAPFGRIGSDYSSGSPFAGEILSVKFTDNAIGDELFHGLTLADYLDAAGGYEREIATYNGSDMYGTLLEPITLESGDTITIVFATANTVTAMNLVDGDVSAVDRGYIYCTSGQKLAWNTSVYSGVALDGIAATSGVTDFPVDGIVHVVTGVLSASGIIGHIGCNQDGTTSFWEDEILSLATTVSGVTTTYPLNSGSTVYELPEGEVLGSEIIIDGDFTTDTVDKAAFDAAYPDWISPVGQLISTSGGTVSIDRNGGSYTSLAQTIATTSEDAEVFSFEITALSHGVDVTINGATTNFTTTGIKNVAFKALASTTIVYMSVAASLAATGSYKTISTKPAPKALAYEGLSLTDWNTYARSNQSANYILDNDNTVFQQARGYVLGSDVVTNSGEPFTSTDGYAAQGTGSIAVVSSNIDVTQLAAWDDGVLYVLPTGTWETTKVVRFKVGMGTSTLVQLQAGNGNYGHGAFGSLNITASGEYEIITSTGLGGSGISAKASTASTFSIELLSTKESPKALAYNGFTLASIELFALNRQDNWWEGVELVTDGGFDTACGVNWICTSPWVISSSKATADGSQSATIDLYQDVEPVDGNCYVQRTNVSEHNAGILNAILDGDVGANIIAAGIYTDVYSPLISVGTHTGLRGDADFDGVAVSVSVKRILELP